MSAVGWPTPTRWWIKYTSISCVEQNLYSPETGRQEKHIYWPADGLHGMPLELRIWLYCIIGLEKQYLLNLMIASVGHCY